MRQEAMIMGALALATSLTLSNGAQADGHKWTGCYLGANVGYITQPADADITDGVSALSFTTAADDVTYGVAVGCDAQLDRFVVGVFGDIDWTSAGDTMTIATVFGDATIGEIGIKRLWSIGGRAGFLLTPTTLAYGLLAYTQVEADGGIGSADVELASVNLADAEGITVGGGIEALFAPGWALKLEYRYTDLDGDTLHLSPDPEPIDAHVDANLHHVRLGVSYRFGMDQPNLFGQ